MAVVYFSLGANIGDKRNNMITAVALLSERVGSILALSDLYETTPWGFVSENNFGNLIWLPWSAKAQRGNNEFYTNEGENV